MHKLLAKLSSQDEKTKVVFRNTVGAFLVKGAALVVSLYTMPSYMRYFADEQVLGVWFTVLSVLTWILNFDLGIGNGLRNKLTEAIAANDRQATREFISSAYWLLGIVMLIIAVIGALLIETVNWNSVFNVDIATVPADVLCIVVRYAFIGIVLQFFLRLISSVLYALQKSAVNNFISLITSVLQLAFVLTAPQISPIESLKMFSLAYVFCANLPLLAASVLIFAGPMKDCLPKIRYVDRAKARSVLTLGGIFFLCQILYMVIANTNEFFVTQYTNPGNVVEYQIYYKLFSLISTVYMLALTPVWSAVSKANSENDMGWLRRLNIIIFKVSLLAVAAEFLLIPFLQLVINIWLQEEAIQVNYIYALSFALFGAAMVYQSGVSTIVCGIGKMKLQAICYAVGVVGKFVIIDLGIKYTGSWIFVVLANALILIPYCILQQLQLNRYFGRGQAEV